MQTAKTEPQRGKFIVFEGIDGSGKSTQSSLLTAHLQALGLPCYRTFEPTDSPIGSLIHQMMTGRIQADNRVIAALFVADRFDHLTNPLDGFKKKLDAGVTVIADRYYFSSYAYHGVDLDMDWVIAANSISADLQRPDITVFLDVPVKKAVERLAKGRFHTELFEHEERLTKVREKYFEAFEKQKDCERVAVIDADADAETIAQRVWAAVQEIL